jgi:hypothetical protein
MHYGFDLYGNFVLRPALMETDLGLFALAECPVHGLIAQRIIVTDDVPQQRPRSQGYASSN